jgi:phosphoribosylaminoimidazole-succinocarboxamide synthase
MQKNLEEHSQTISLDNFFEQSLSDTNLFEKHNYKGLNKQEKQKLSDTNIHFFSGKVRDCIINNKNIILLHTDRLTAFDRTIGYAPCKGIILAHINHFWHKKAQEFSSTCQTKLINERTLLMKKLIPIKLEIIVRGYLAGSILRDYKKGERLLYDYKLPDGLEDYQRFEEPLITPTTKADKGEHDEAISYKNIISEKICTKEQLDKIYSIAIALFKLGTEVYNKIDWILVDTKYEFGIDENGNISVMDEIHTPDSSRFWKKSTYVSQSKKNVNPEIFDKDIIRNHLLEQGFSGDGRVPYVAQAKYIQLLQAYYYIYKVLTKETIAISKKNNFNLNELNII